MAIYDKHYQKKNYFGKPYPELLHYLDGFTRDKMILDLGCGQGRDVLALGRMGFRVKGLDISNVGISQLSEVIHKENLEVTTEVMDYKRFKEIAKYDVVLMNSMFHFYKSDLEEETKSLKWVLHEMKTGGKLILIVQESKFRKEHIKNILKDLDLSLKIELEKSIIYEEFNSKFYFVSILKS